MNQHVDIEINPRDCERKSGACGCALWVAINHDEGEATVRLTYCDAHRRANPWAVVTSPNTPSDGSPRAATKGYADPPSVPDAVHAMSRRVSELPTEPVPAMQPARKVRVLTWWPGRRPVVTLITHKFSAQQELVGGYVQEVNMGGPLRLVVNEDGPMQGLPENRFVPQIAQRLVGTFFLKRVDAKGEIIDLTDEDIERWSRELP